MRKTLSESVLQKRIDKGTKLQQNGDYEKALEIFNEVLTQSKKQALYKYQVKALLAIGIISRVKGNYIKALDFYQKAIALSNSHNDIKACASCYNNIGIIYKELGKYDAALDHYFKSLRIREEMNDLDNSANVLNNIGIIYNIINQNEKAEEFFFKSLQMRIKSGIKSDIAASYNNLGSYYFKNNDLDKSLDYYQKSLAIKEEINDHSGIAITTNNIGVIHKKSGRMNDAIAFHEKSLAMREKVGEEKGIIISKINLANDYLDIGNYNESEELINSALESAEAISSEQMIEKCYSTLSELKEKQNDFKQSLQYYKQFSKLKNKLVDQKIQNKINEIQMNYENEINNLKQTKLLNLMMRVRDKNRQLRKHRSHLRLINKILRHDLKNKLASTKSSLRMFNSTQEKHFIDSGFSAINDSIRLIDKMRELEIMIQKSGELEFINLKNIFMQSATNYPELHCKFLDNRIRRNKPCTVLADSTLGSVFDNILGNALRHSGSKSVTASIDINDKWVQMLIADNGKGIADDLKSKVFNEGYTYGETAHTGLGLFIVKQSMERYGGFVYIEDNHPVGTVFVLHFKAIN